MNTKQNRRGATVRQARPSFPKRHVAIAGFLLCVSLVLLMLPSDDVSATRITVPLELALEEPALAEPPPVQEVWDLHEVRSGDNLSLIFQRAGLNDRDVYNILNNAPGAKSLTRIYPGQQLGFILSEEGKLEALRYTQSPLASIVFRTTDGGWTVDNQTREPQIQRSYASATIDSSLFLAGQNAGLPQNIIMELANIFGGVIDFVLDPRKGDTFYVLFEELYIDGEKLGNGDILAAEFVNRGTSYTAFQYVAEDGSKGYFSEDGVSMRKAFLMAPVDFTRISSNFNPRRLHPIYKTTRPHRGTDYAAPRGTPVFASGDGKVVAAGYSQANGNYVFIQHGQQYTTKYLHLHKRTVKKGQRVSQHQVIGSVGSTGAATGAHLHYEFLVNGVHRNPRTIHKKLPKAKSLAAAEMSRFAEQTRSLNMQLASLRQTQFAENTVSADTTNTL